MTGSGVLVEVPAPATLVEVPMPAEDNNLSSP
eukprot:CAMPEP_0197853850 /NCGR_PEP_ID=MMETSP1438-20131217/23542_1 /TAXON_ID=1461541 /ORGANISM="Pterosperma sp., Strain CCMP1384" /LENGTH=31 /DNA_ID= /DNA_START= /DNA_END= /DNA_ORIENTATION=